MSISVGTTRLPRSGGPADRLRAIRSAITSQLTPSSCALTTSIRDRSAPERPQHSPCIAVECQYQSRFAYQTASSRVFESKQETTAGTSYLPDVHAKSVPTRRLVKRGGPPPLLRIAARRSRNASAASTGRGLIPLDRPEPQGLSDTMVTIAPTLRIKDPPSLRQPIQGS